MSRMEPVDLEYIYVTIPKDYICVYHRILVMLADYGEDMLKDCKASCTDRNSGVIECFNMFNSAVAARKLGKTKLAETLIKYIKAKITQIYGGVDNQTSFVFPVDESGQLKAIVSCGDTVSIEISADDGNLYNHKFEGGYDEHFRLGPEDESPSGDDEPTPEPEVGLVIEFTPEYHIVDGSYRPCGDLIVRYDGESVDPNDCVIQYYFDNEHVARLNDVTDLTVGSHNFKVVVTYSGETKIANVDLNYEGTN